MELPTSHLVQLFGTASAGGALGPPAEKGFGATGGAFGTPVARAFRAPAAADADCRPMFVAATFASQSGPWLAAFDNLQVQRHFLPQCCRTCKLSNAASHGPDCEAKGCSKDWFAVCNCSRCPKCTNSSSSKSASSGCTKPSRWQHLQHHNLLHALRMLSTSMEALLRRVLSPPTDFDTGPDTGSRDAARFVTPKPTSGCSDLPSFKHTEISEALNWAYKYLCTVLVITLLQHFESHDFNLHHAHALHKHKRTYHQIHNQI